MKRIVVANSNCCRIFDYQRSGNLTLIKEISVPENKLKNSQLSSDRPGRYHSNTTSRGAYVPSCDMKEVHIDNFARKVANELEHERACHDFKQLIVIMPSHMDGLLHQHLNKNVKALIVRTIKKNIASFSGRDLLTYIKTYALG
jgi:protein required for attachment to host cells